MQIRKKNIGTMEEVKILNGKIQLGVSFASRFLRNICPSGTPAYNWNTEGVKVIRFAGRIMP